MATVRKPQEWLAAHPNRHPLFILPGVTITSYAPDVMHTLHLGVFEWIFGSIIKLLTHYVMPDDIATNRENFWDTTREVYAAWYSDSGATPNV